MTGNVRHEWREFNIKLCIQVENEMSDRTSEKQNLKF